MNNFGQVLINSAKFECIRANLLISGKFVKFVENLAEFGFIQTNSRKFSQIQENLHIFGKIRRNFRNSVKFVCIRTNSGKFGKILVNLDRFSKIGEYSGLIWVYQRKFEHVSANSDMFGLIGSDLVKFGKNQDDLINQCKFDKIWSYPINLMKTGYVHVNPGNASNSNEFGKTWAFPGNSRKPLKFQTNPGKSRQILKLPTSSNSTSYARLNGHSSTNPAWHWLCFD
uniref:Uncharacterized protein n=1 Tax=Vespula pensylvanica TaxID=30213 RepID=A0A834NR53_VESPE|nr:hypothetical protein H0235_011012 [Vespula pensylvanica]